MCTISGVNRFWFTPVLFAGDNVSDYIEHLEKPLKISVLLDTYGSLLTDRQADAIDLHYNEDLSLAEIGEIYNISRQGVRSTITKGVTTLQECEEKLNLVEKDTYLNRALKNVLTKLEEDNIDEAKSILKNLIDDGDV